MNAASQRNCNQGNKAASNGTHQGLLPAALLLLALLLLASLLWPGAFDTVRMTLDVPASALPPLPLAAVALPWLLPAAALLFSMLAGGRRRSVVAPIAVPPHVLALLPRPDICHRQCLCRPQVVQHCRREIRRGGSRDNDKPLLSVLLWTGGLNNRDRLPIQTLLPLPTTTISAAAATGTTIPIAVLAGRLVVMCYIFGVLWYLFRVLIYQPHVTA